MPPNIWLLQQHIGSYSDSYTASLGYYLNEQEAEAAADFLNLHLECVKKIDFSNTKIFNSLDEQVCILFEQRQDIADAEGQNKPGYLGPANTPSQLEIDEKIAKLDKIKASAYQSLVMTVLIAEASDLEKFIHLLEYFDYTNYWEDTKNYSVTSIGFIGR